MTRSEILSMLEERILIIDGAMGTMIQRHSLTESDFQGLRFKDWGYPLMGNNDLLSITQPEVIESIHREYIEAGADIIETNTFSAQAISMADYGMEDLCHELNLASAQVARRAADHYIDRQVIVAGSIGPTNRTLSMSPDVNNPAYRAVTFEEVVQAYRTQIEGLIEGGVDVILIETIFDTLNAKAAIYTVQTIEEEKGIELPIMISGTITDASGRTLSGQTLEAFYTSVEHANPISIGFNCALGAREMQPFLQELDRLSDFAISAYPNAGLPNAMGEYDQSPEEMADITSQWSREGYVNILGGCCGTTPDHIRAMAEQVRGIKPRPLRYERA